MSDELTSRRDFARRGSALVSSGVAVAASLTMPQHAWSGPSDEGLRVAVIGAGRRGFGSLTRSLVKLRNQQRRKIDLVAVCDVYSVHRDQFVDHVKAETGLTPTKYIDHRELLDKEDVDAVVIGVPDHWHAAITLDALAAGKHVYCEKPMTHTIAEAEAVVSAWRASGLILQVGVQSTSLPVWDMAREMINTGQLGKIVQFQTECARNGTFGMSRHNVITKEMTPQNIDFRRFLGVDEGLAPEMPFDRATFGQWRCYWPFGYGMYSDLYVHRVTGMLKATGLRMPGRVVGGGGIYLEYDGRQVADVGSILADFHEGVQGVVTSTMVSAELKLEHLIRGHHGLVRFDQNCSGNSGKGTFEFVPERPQVTGNSKLRRQEHSAQTPLDTVSMHMSNWLDAIDSNQPNSVNNDPQLGAAAVMIVNLAVRSYREGKVFHVDRGGRVQDGNPSWADRWERMSAGKAQPKHVPGWTAGDQGSVMKAPEYQRLEGPWIDGLPPKA